MLCLRNFPVAKNSMDKRGGYGGIKFFRRKFFVLHGQKIPQGKPSVCHQFRLWEIFLLQRVVTIFCRKFFCLIVPKKSVEEQFCAVFQKKSGGEKLYG